MNIKKSTILVNNKEKVLWRCKLRISDNFAGLSGINRASQIAGIDSFTVSNASIQTERVHFEEILQECN